MKMELRNFFFQISSLVILGFLFVLIILNLPKDIERIENYENNFTGRSTGVITGESNGGRWIHFGIEWIDPNGHIHRGSSNLPIEDYAIGDSVKIRFDVNNPNQFVYDLPSEIYLPLQKTLVLLVFFGGFLLYKISQFFY